MTRHAHLDPSPFYLEGSTTAGVVLIHGFTGSPPEMRLLGDYLHSRGLTVSAPLLPGHGTTAEDLNRRAWREWVEHVQGTLSDMQGRCRIVFLGGFSLGSGIALYLAARGLELPGLIAYSPALKTRDWRARFVPVLKYLAPRFPKEDEFTTDPDARQRNWSYETRPLSAAHQVLKLFAEVRRSLPRVTCPLLIIHSTLDTEIHATSAQLTYDLAGSRDKELVTLNNSGHALVMDSEWKTVAAKTYSFVLGHLPGDAPSPERPLVA